MYKFNLKFLNNIQGINKDNTFVALDCPQWSNAGLLSINLFETLLKKENISINLNEHVDNKTIIIDPSTLKITINNNYIPSVFSQSYDENLISIKSSFKSESVMSGLQLMADENFLYIWIEKLNKWKRLLLSDF